MLTISEKKRVILNGIIISNLSDYLRLVDVAAGWQEVNPKSATVCLLSQIIEDNPGLGGATLLQVTLLFTQGKIRF